MPTSLHITYKQVVLFFCFGLVASLIFSPFTLSVSMISLAVLGLLQLEIVNWRPVFRYNPGFGRAFRLLRRQPAFAVLLLFFVIALVRFYPIGDEAYLMARLRIKVPFVVLPFTFLALPRFSKQDIQQLLYFLLVTLTLTSLAILGNYLQHFEELNELLKQGHHIPTPRNHIRYSLFTAWGIIGGLYLWWEGYFWRFRQEKWWIIGMVIFLFFFLHLLSVKTGLLVLYGSLFLGVLQFMWARRAWLLGGLFILTLVAIPIIAYQAIPSLKNKINYFTYDLFKYRHGEGADYSDSGRLASLDVGWQIARDNWLWGIGTANMRPAVEQLYAEQYPNYPYAFMPQNQFLFSWASAGVLGLLATIFAFFFPLLYRKAYRDPLFLNFYASIFAIIMIEHALENAVGVAHYLFFLLLFLSYFHRIEGPPPPLSNFD